MRYKLAIFDFDGTLADSAAWSLEAYNDLAERFGLRKVDPEEIEPFRGLNSREVLRQLGVPFWKLPRSPGFPAHGGGQGGPNCSLSRRRRHVRTPPRERGAVIALATSNAEVAVRSVMGERMAASVAYFECGAPMFGSAPSRLKRILRRSGVPKQHAILIGDETRDIEAAIPPRALPLAPSAGVTPTPLHSSRSLPSRRSPPWRKRPFQCCKTSHHEIWPLPCGRAKRRQIATPLIKRLCYLAR